MLAPCTNHWLIVAAMLAAVSLVMATDLPPECPADATSHTNVYLPPDEGFVSFVQTESGSLASYYYSRQLGVAAELIRPQPANPAGKASYKLYSVGNNVSAMSDWPNGPCTPLAAANNDSALGLSLTELRDYLLNVTGNGTSGPSLLLLTAGGDLALSLTNASVLNSLHNLQWSIENATVGVACFPDNSSNNARNIWLARVEMTSNDTKQASVSSLTLQLFQQAILGNTTGWNATNLRFAYRFLAPQRLAAVQSPATAPDVPSLSSMANLPPFTACGTVRESSRKPPKLPANKRLTILTVSASDQVVEIVDDTYAMTAFLTPKAGDPIASQFGTGRLQLVQEKPLKTDAAAAPVFAVDLSNGYCSMMVPQKMAADQQPIPPMLPFSLDNPNWLFTGDRVPLPDAAGAQTPTYCSRFLLLGNASSFEVYFSGNEYQSLLGYSILRHQLNPNGTGYANSMEFVRVARFGDASSQLDYDGLAGCSLGNQSARLLMQMRVDFDTLQSTSPAKLVSDTRIAVSKAAAAVWPLRVALVTVARDADPKKSQIWFTLLGSPLQPSSLAESLAALNKAVTSSQGLSVSNWRVDSLQESAVATDSAGCHGDVVHTGYSGGAMGALAFFMLLAGGGLGVLGAFCMWKRRPNMPYYVQD